MALNLKDSPAAALQWAEGVRAGGGSIAEASYQAWMQTLDRAGIPW